MKTDQKIAFVINIYQEPAETVSALQASLTQFYPDVPIVIVPDGRHGRLKTPEHAGRWISRYLDWGMASNPDWLVKIDPDAVVKRRIIVPFRGDVQCAKKRFKLKDREDFFPHAGVIAYSREAATKIREEALNERYINYPGTRHDYQEEILIKAICAKLGLSINDRPDFQCGLRRNRNPNPLATFIHR